MFDPQHLQGARPELVQSMFKIGQKAAELERTKLQSEIRKEESKLQQKKLEERLKMAGKARKTQRKQNPRRNKKKMTIS